MQDGRPGACETRDKEASTAFETNAEAPMGGIQRHVWSRPVNTEKPCILVVDDDDSISKVLQVFLRRAGLASECVRSMKAGCDRARSGRFQVVVTNPRLSDGSWKRLAEIDSHYRPGFVVILLAARFDSNEWGQALEDGAFEVLDATHELPKVAEVAKRALWAAYLKGAGPLPKALNTLD
jgi:DNA-binding NtrC family response regulator